MNLPEAIEILTKERQEHHSFSTDIIGKAEQLGIEALQRIEVGRNNPGTHWNDPLPGEE